MSEESVITSEKMEISGHTSDLSSQEVHNSSLQKGKQLSTNNDSAMYSNDNTNPSLINKNISLSQNATDSHPLMYSPTSPISPDYPDLIPETAKNKNSSHEKLKFTPQAHSTAVEEINESLDKYLNLDLDIENYEEKLPDFPDSPSAMKKSLIYDLPLETSHNELSDTENDKSVYEAHLSSNLQNVALTMNEKEGNLNFLAHNKKSNKLRRIKFVHIEDDQDSDLSSLDSNSDSLKSEDVFNGENDNAQNLDETNSPEPIEPLSAADERRHARHWQRMVLPGGEQRTIDMRVIEPYKRVLSHGGYLRAGGHTAIVIFAACYLPDRSRVDYDYVMDNLFLYVLWTLERLVTDDYVLVYLHGGATKLPSFSWIKRCYQLVGRKLRKNLTHMYLVHPTLWIKTMLFMAKPFIRYVLWTLERLVTDDYVLVYLHGGATKLPSFSWIKRCYQLVGRKLRKNLTHMYLVHPTLWIKTMLFMAKPFISSKFYRKISYIASIRDLMNRIPLEGAAIPDKVKAYDSFHCSSS